MSEPTTIYHTASDAHVATREAISRNQSAAFREFHKKVDAVIKWAAENGEYGCRVDLWDVPGMSMSVAREVAAAFRARGFKAVIRPCSFISWAVPYLSVRWTEPQISG